MNLLFSVFTFGLVLLVVSNVHGMFDKEKAAEAKNNPMVSMVIGMLGKDCEDLYDKCMDKVDKVYQPMWDWLMGSCNKLCGTSAEMQEAIQYLYYGLRLADRIFKWLEDSKVNFKIWKLCPKMLNREVYIGYIDKIQKVCLKKKPDGFNVLHAKDLCHLTATKSFNKTADCIKELIIKDVSAKVIPPPMDCVGNVKQYCAPKNHPLILEWIEILMEKLLKVRNDAKTVKDKSGNPLEPEWNPFAALQKFFNNKCKAVKAFVAKYKMITK